MVKSIVVFDGYSGTKRRTLLHKKVFASDCDNIVTQSLDYIFTVYNTSKIKRVFVMGDGAKWIKSLPQYYKFESTTQVYYCLDKFHFKQALHHLAMNSDYEKYLLGYILNDNKRAFNQLVHFIKSEHLKREDTINKQNIKHLCLTNFNSTEIKHISIEHLNFDIFDRYKTFIPTYKNKLFTPSIGQYFH